ncbi:MAG: hypothetical protein PHP45_03135 [Elusimicrobiales bacterium]|nr:hypothetical protein [Elusimicrobiales bacterium]
MKRKGFTLIEVEIAITLIFFAVTGFGLLTMNGLKQLQRLETFGQQCTYVTPSGGAVITGVIYSTQTPRPDSYAATVNSITIHPSSADAKITLTSLP